MPRISEREDEEVEKLKRKRTPSPKRSRRRKNRKNRRFKVDAAFNDEKFDLDKKTLRKRSDKKRKTVVGAKIDFFELKGGDDRITFGKIDTRKPVYKPKKKKKNVDVSQEITISQYEDIKKYLEKDGMSPPNDKLDEIIGEDKNNDYQFRPKGDKKRGRKRFGY